MNKNNLLVRYDKDLRLRIMFPEARKEITNNVVRFVRKAPGMNFVSFTFANESRLHQVIHQELEYFVPLDQPKRAGIAFLAPLWLQGRRLSACEKGQPNDRLGEK